MYESTKISKTLQAFEQKIMNIQETNIQNMSAQLKNLAELCERSIVQNIGSYDRTTEMASNISETNSKFEVLTKQISTIPGSINNLVAINTKLKKEIDILHQLNMMDTSVYQCWTGTVSGIVPEIEKTCSIKLMIINLNHKTHNENKQWMNNGILKDTDVDGHINGVFHYNYHYKEPHKTLLRSSPEVITNNPFIMNNDPVSNYNAILEIVCDTNTHYKYFDRIINWLVEKTMHGNPGSNMKKNFVWKKSLVPTL
jgi:hypothetical protein